MTVALGVGLAAALAWYFSRGVSRRRLHAPGFFLIAVLVHVVLGIGSFYVYLDPVAGAAVRREFHRMVVSTRTSLAGLRGLLKPSDDAFDQVADLKSEPTEDVSPGPRTGAPAPPVAAPSDVPASLEPLPPRPVMPSLMVATDDDAAGWDSRRLGRRRAPVAIAAEAIALESIGQAAPTSPTAEERVEGAAVIVGRRPGNSVPVGVALDGAESGPAASLPGPPARGGVSSGVAGAGSSDEAFGPLALAQLPALKRAIHPVPGPLAEVRAEIENLGPAATGSSAATTGTGGAGSGLLPGLGVGVEVARRVGPAAPANAASLTSAAPWSPPVLPPGLPGGASGGGTVALADFGDALGRSPDRIPRRVARGPGMLPAEEKVGLQAMFSHRQGDTKREAVETFGGNVETVAAVHRGLSWLDAHQHADGYWSLNRFYNQEPGQRYTGQGSLRADAAATGFALLPFLGDGHTHLAGDHQAPVRNGLQWLVEHQKPDGDLSWQVSGNSRMYCHAIAAIAICEAYGMTKDANLQGPAQRAVDFIVKAQNKKLGGWRYQPVHESDMSVVGWQVMALKSAQMAALGVPDETLEGVRTWLDCVAGKGNQAGQFRYQPGGPFSPAMTAEGLLCMQYLGADRSHPQLQAGAAYLLKNLPKQGRENSYFWYYGTQVMYHLQGDYWPQWNAALRDLLVQSQRKDGPLAGTWDPVDGWEREAGRIYATSLRLLMLSVYYRHLPLYRSLERQPR